MSEYVLYYAPGTCARVSAICLNEAGQAFTPRLVKFMAGENRQPEYMALNPRAKVPCLIVDGKPLTENVAIVSLLAERFPDAGILPRHDDPVARAQVLADLVWCTSTLHPIITRLRLPMFFCDVEGAAVRVAEMAAGMMAPNFALIEQRLADRQWWYGDWSAMDAYLFWIWFRTAAPETLFDATPYPNYAAHAARMAERDSVKRWLAVEAAADEELKALGLHFQMPDMRKLAGRG